MAYSPKKSKNFNYYAWGALVAGIVAFLFLTDKGKSIKEKIVSMFKPKTV